MTTLRTRTIVGADGKIVIPVGTADVGKSVDVTVSPVVEHSTINGLPRDEWFALFDRTEGSIDDDRFVRPPQTVYVHRLPFD